MEKYAMPHDARMSAKAAILFCNIGFSILCYLLKDKANTSPGAIKKQRKTPERHALGFYSK
jgi:hypothetical protein